MIEHGHNSACLSFNLVRVDDRADGLPPAKGRGYGLVCKGLLNDKKERYRLEPEELQRSDSAIFPGNRLVGLVAFRNPTDVVYRICKSVQIKTTKYEKGSQVNLYRACQDGFLYPA